MVARFSASQIYAFARAAGFSPDESATMTAVALAESGGNARAHNPYGEDSRGLWQINARAHPGLASRYDLYDPAQNARAAFEVSMRGEDISPWTTTHGGSGARYVRFRGEAEAAAVAYGDGWGRGMWTGTSGYGDTTDAGSDAGGGFTPVDVVDSPSGSSADVFLAAALSQSGDTYVFGAETVLTDADPEAFDCSELVQWAAAQADVEMPDGAMNQYLFAKQHGYLVPVSEAAEVPGALLFNFSVEPTPGGARPSVAHVAISVGDGTTIEARGTSYGVDEFEVGDRFTYAAVIPELAGGDPGAWLAGGGPDTDGDRIPDAEEVAKGLDSRSPDTDRDGVTDGHEVLVSKTDPRLADTDADRFSDAFEIARGLDPLHPDVGAGSELDADFTTAEAVIGADLNDDEAAFGDAEWNSALSDTDADGYSDAIEKFSGSDVSDPTSTPLHPAGVRDDRVPEPDPFDT